MAKPDSFRELIDVTFGGRSSFANATGIDVKHVDVMRHRNSIAPEHWPNVVRAANKLSIDFSLDDLTCLRLKRRDETRASGSKAGAAA